MEIKEYCNNNLEQIISLYKKVGWINYLKLENKLKDAFNNSLLTLCAYEDDKIVGLIRVVGDGISIIFIQDILVDPLYQGKKIGSSLVKMVLDKYKDVYQIELLTDDTKNNKEFYEKLGFKEVSASGCIAFVKINL